MRTFILFILAGLIACAPANAAIGKIYCDGDDWLFDDDISVEFDDGSLIFEYEDDDEYVEITEEYELIVNGERVDLDKGERRLVRQYYRMYEEIIEEAEEIGIEGAKIGVQGAKVGVQAIIGILKLLSEDYDSDDLEEEMEEAGERIELRAEKLEEAAERLEDDIRKLRRIHRKLRRDVDELDELDWF